VTGAIEIAGIEQGDAGLERGMNGGDALAFIGGPIEIAHPHAAQTNGGDDRTFFAQTACFHGGLAKGIGLRI
jgi:hypothetical protein